MPDLRFPDGVLFFPVTPFDAGDRVDSELLQSHVSDRVDAGAAAVFAACGTGEFHALGADDYDAAVSAAVAGAARHVPVIAGTGGPLGHARACAQSAERLGADGLLVLPPYLVAGPQSGLLAYVKAIAASTELPLIVYHRGASQFTADTVAALLEIPTVVGIKDGVGDIALAQRFVRVAANSGRDILFFNGLLTAELSQNAYRAIGVPLYSSAVFAMAPEIANGFYRAYRADDSAAMALLLDDFYVPLVSLRDETPGFAVSLIKAGVRMSGMPVGPVRAPLVDPTPEQTDRLARLLDRGRELVA